MVDLHLHSTASDGHLSPAELMKLCKNMGFSTVALTDHDTICGIKQAQQAADELGMTLIPGVEISAGGCPETHILGYGIDLDCQIIRDLFRCMRLARRRRIELFVQKLQEVGVGITYEDVLQDAPNERSIGRPHLGHALVRLGYASDLSEAFSKYLVKSCKTYVPREKVKIAEALGAINAARGVAVLAHPALLRYDLRTLQNAVIYMRALGLQGIECYHSRHDRESARAYRQLAEKMDLLITGGSDFHGGVVSKKQPLPMPGDGLKYFSDGDACAQRLIEAIQRRKTENPRIE